MGGFVEGNAHEFKKRALATILRVTRRLIRRKSSEERSVGTTPNASWSKGREYHARGDGSFLKYARGRWKSPMRGWRWQQVSRGVCFREVKRALARKFKIDAKENFGGAKRRRGAADGKRCEWRGTAGRGKGRAALTGRRGGGRVVVRGRTIA